MLPIADGLDYPFDTNYKKQKASYEKEVKKLRGWEVEKKKKNLKAHKFF